MKKSETFKREIAPVYLRRLRGDVLDELPEKIEIEDWCEMNPYEEDAYVQALRYGSFMDVRRVSWNTNNPDNSTKLRRLNEICEEAKSENKKVVVFSFFLKTLDSINETLNGQCYGPLSGRVKPDERQRILDEFLDSPGGSVLIAQINTAGVGLNIQSASVVVICEPQLKPTVEDQAISRVYRMGQINNVIVHRLLSINSIDERMLERLNYKTGLFNKYANDSIMDKESKVVLERIEMQEFVEEELLKRGLKARKDGCKAELSIDRK